MRFKEFLAVEDANSSEKGLMISGKDKPGNEKGPNDGQPFAQYLGSFGPKQSAGGGAPAGGAMMMKKKMKKKMKAT